MRREVVRRSGRPAPPGVDERELRRRFEVERRLAKRLRLAPATDRARLYGEVYDEYYREIGATREAGDPEVTRLQRRLLAPLLERRTRFLEIGAGDAALARSLVGEVASVTVIEASEGAVGGERLGIDWCWLSPSEAPHRLEPQSVDLAFSSHFAEHLHPDDLADHLRDVHRWCAPGGSYVMVTPNRLFGPHDVSGYFSHQAQGFHLREYTHRELAAAFAQAGWRDLSTLSGGPLSRPRRLAPVLLAERLLEAILAMAPVAARDWLLESSPWAARRPFRPLEQVVLLARRSGPDGAPPAPQTPG
ncbi:MAG: methyltransferase domain-containing protein [Acidobacteria bacterium]|nr:MAG: methyltransferase domain-containing protein [Acidobacteriota bacterium]REK07777.1 MAG: methyltransferase domain-containing protein [Acidobacteriota bacterium]